MKIGMELRRQIRSIIKEALSEEGGNPYFPGVGETVSGEDVDHDLMDYFNRTNRRLLVTMKNGEEVTTSCAKYYDDLVFFGKQGILDKGQIAYVKIIS